MLTGLKGVKYGLQPGAKPKTKPVQQTPINVFGDDDDESDIGKDIARHAAKKQSDIKVTQMHAAALAEDASVFDYDGVYDSIQEARVQPKQQEKLQRKSRYIEGLLEKAKEREQEQDIIYERTLLKERAAEDHLFGDKDKFVTAAYKKKLEEDQKWLAAERIREARDAKADVVKAGHMGNFYRNVLTNNAAFGTAQPAAPVPARPTPASDETLAAGPAAAPDSAFEAARRAREAYEAAKESGAAAAPTSAPEQAHASREDRRNERTREGDEKRERGLGSREGARAEPSGRDRQGDKGARSSPTAQDGKKEHKRGDAMGAPSKEIAEAPPAAAAAAAPKPPEEDKEAKAAAARERFLARKRKTPAS